MDHDAELRSHLLELLKGGHAHATFAHTVADLPAELRGKKVKGFPKTAWMLLEHLRIAQHDILEFSRNPKYQSPPWPDGYWPPTPAPPDDAAWDKSIKAFETDHRALLKLVRSGDLYARIPWGDGQTLLREAMLVADHNAYHLGQLVDLLRALGAWPAG